ncbi:MAG: DNA-binding protein [Betaproteobacteria bacterium]
MNRADLQQLANTRLAEARALLAAGHAPGAYYLAGYVIECALKACIAKGVQQYDFPDRDKVIQSYSDNLVRLLKIAGLEPTLDGAIKQRQALADNWAVVKDWSESKRYALTIVTQDATDLVAAVGDPANGVLTWVTQHW